MLLLFLSLIFLYIYFFFLLLKKISTAVRQEVTRNKVPFVFTSKIRDSFHELHFFFLRIKIKNLPEKEAESD
jgi:hypothetical protein